MHLGRTNKIAHELADRYPTLMEDMATHFMRVNGVSRDVYRQHMIETAQTHAWRSGTTGRWTTAISLRWSLRSRLSAPTRPEFSEASGGQLVRGTVAGHALRLPTMDPTDIRKWFDDYLSAYSGSVRGERDTESMLAYYAVPLLLTSDTQSVVLLNQEQVLGTVRQLIDQLQAAGWDRADMISCDVSVVNRTSALVRNVVSRQRRDGSEIGRPTFTYVLTDGSVGRRISAILTHGQ
jgi:uncharacterized NTF2-like protein DUF6841